MACEQRFQLNEAKFEDAYRNFYGGNLVAAVLRVADMIRECAAHRFKGLHDLGNATLE